jgi:hypothetical protein
MQVDGVADHDDIAGRARRGMARLTGQRLLRSRNFCATRHFYFGDPGLDSGTPEPVYTLGLECPWRLRAGAIILVGSEDYYEPAEGNADPSWEPGNPSGHLQDQKLADALGELRDGDIFNTGSAFVVESLETDRYGGLTLGMSGGYFLDAVPCSRGQMEWILLFADGGSLVLMNGTINLNEAQPKSPAAAT